MGANRRPFVNGIDNASLDDRLVHFQWRVVQDALQEASSAYWLRRAQTFESVGSAPCDLIALNCRRKAELLRELALDDVALGQIQQLSTL